MYIMYTSASNNAPSYTLVSLYVLWRVHPLGDTILFMVLSVADYLELCSVITSYNEFYILPTNIL